jgi:phosphomannomutase
MEKSEKFLNNYTSNCTCEILNSYFNKIPKSNLENLLFSQVNSKTPDYIKNNPVIDQNNSDGFFLTIEQKHLQEYADNDFNPESPAPNRDGLGLLKWFKNYKKEALVSTAGIRGQQNIIYPWDTRFPINTVGIVIATAAKAMVAKERFGNKQLHKLAAGEVRYNTDTYIDLIARTQAAFEITTHVPCSRQTIPIWLASFLAFKLDLLGGEYVTSSHGISVKTATKDLNNQGSQYLPEESIEFVNKISEIFEEINQKGEYKIFIAPKNSSFIREDAMKKLNNGIDLYIEYLQNGVVSDFNLELIKKLNNKIYIENVGGCAYTTLSKILEKLGVDEKFGWFNIEEDPFFHDIGKEIKIKNNIEELYDHSVDAALIIKKDNKTRFPVIETMNYADKLANKPDGTVILMTDPDHDRLSIAQIESSERINKLESFGIDFLPLDDKRVLTVYTPNQGFLMLMDFYAKQLKTEGKWNNHNRFMIKTTASAMAWDEWAKSNNVKVVNVPVGFKEIAGIMKKVEKQLIDAPDMPVKVRDVFGNIINLGVNPRLIFAGEESGGMIMGPEKLIESKSGRKAIAMREKSATEAIFVASSLVAHLSGNKTPLLSDNLEKVFDQNNIIGRYDIREDVVYYNENEADPVKLQEEKEKGEILRTKNDIFYLSMALSKDQLSMDNIKLILQETFDTLDFSNLIDIKFVGDGTYLEFSDKFIEIRPSGTDAKTKAYGAGKNKSDCLKFAQLLGNYSGERSIFHKKYVSDNIYENSKELAMEMYARWAEEDSAKDNFTVPDYNVTVLEFNI